jgi:hypothetical protein
VTRDGLRISLGMAAHLAVGLTAMLLRRAADWLESDGQRAVKTVIG